MPRRNWGYVHILSIWWEPMASAEGWVSILKLCLGPGLPTATKNDFCPLAVTGILPMPEAWKTGLALPHSGQAMVSSGPVFSLIQLKDVLSGPCPRFWDPLETLWSICSHPAAIALTTSLGGGGAKISQLRAGCPCSLQIPLLETSSLCQTRKLFRFGLGTLKDTHSQKKHTSVQTNVAPFKKYFPRAILWIGTQRGRKVFPSKQQSPTYGQWTF